MRKLNAVFWLFIFILVLAKPVRSQQMPDLGQTIEAEMMERGTNGSDESKLEKIELPVEKNTAAGNELYSLLEKLDPDLKSPVLLSEIGGFSYKEIGDILGINLGTVKSRIHRGMNKLREIAAKEASI